MYKQKHNLYTSSKNDIYDTIGNILNFDSWLDSLYSFFFNKLDRSINKVKRFALKINSDGIITNLFADTLNYYHIVRYSYLNKIDNTLLEEIFNTLFLVEKLENIEEGNTDIHMDNEIENIVDFFYSDDSNSNHLKLKQGCFPYRRMKQPDLYFPFILNYMPSKIYEQLIKKKLYTNLFQ